MDIWFPHRIISQAARFFPSYVYFFKPKYVFNGFYCLQHMIWNFKCGIYTTHLYIQNEEIFPMKWFFFCHHDKRNMFIIILMYYFETLFFHCAVVNFIDLPLSRPKKKKCSPSKFGDPGSTLGGASMYDCHQSVWVVRERRKEKVWDSRRDCDTFSHETHHTTCYFVFDQVAE